MSGVGNAVERVEDWVSRRVAVSGLKYDGNMTRRSQSGQRNP